MPVLFQLTVFGRHSWAPLVTMSAKGWTVMVDLHRWALKRYRFRILRGSVGTYIELGPLTIERHSQTSGAEAFCCVRDRIEKL